MAYLKGKKNDELCGNLSMQYLVQKSDPLVLMRSVPFTLGELKLLDTYISRINITDDTKRTVIFTKEEYEDLMGLSCVDYRTLKKYTRGMLGKIVTLEMPDNAYLEFVLFSKAYYHKDEYGKPIIELTCTEEARELFFCIDKYHYFSYALENIIKLTRKASYLLYLYIRHNRYRKNWDVTLDELRDTVLDCKGQDSYQEYKIFRRDVLDPAVKEINKKTDCQFSYKTVKRGRRVVIIHFTVETLTDTIEKPTDVASTTNTTGAQLTIEQMLTVGSKTEELWKEPLLQFGFTQPQYDELFAVLVLVPKYQLPSSADSLDLQRYHYLDQKAKELIRRDAEHPIRNKYAYLLRIVKNDTL